MQIGAKSETENFSVDDASISDSDKSSARDDIEDKYSSAINSFATATYLSVGLGWNF